MAYRRSCVVYDSWAEMIVNMPDDTAGQLIKNMMRYVFDKGELEFTSPEVQAMFCMIKEKLDADSEKYEEEIKKRSAAGKKGNEKRWMQSQTVANNRKPSHSDKEQSQTVANIADSVSVSVSDSVSVSESDYESESDTVSPSEIKKEKRKRFTPPTVEEVAEYCRERGNHIDPGTFVDFYTSNGWRVGKNPMKDWKSSVRTWEKRDRGSPKVFNPTQYLLDELEKGGFDDTIRDG